MSDRKVIARLRQELLELSQRLAADRHEAPRADMRTLWLNDLTRLGVARRQDQGAA